MARNWISERIQQSIRHEYDQKLAHLNSELRNESEKTRPAQLEILGECEARLTIHEGKYHQVKRMFASIGNKVVGLHRESMGAIRLDPALAPGAFRALTAEEIDSV